MAHLKTLVASIILLFAQSGVVQAQTARDGCFSTEPAQKSCGWTGACSIDGCEGICVPQFTKRVADDLGALWNIQSRTALKCEAFAAIVLGSIGNSSRNLQTTVVDDSSIRRALASFNRASKTGFSGFSRIASASRQMHGMPESSSHAPSLPMFAPSRRLLEDAIDLRQQGCPTAEQVDEAAEKMQYDASIAKGYLDIVLSEEDLKSPGVLLANAIHSNMQNPAALKTLFANECVSSNVTTQPLMDTYYSMQKESHTEDTQGPPNSLQVCRPKDNSDVMYITQVGLLYASCAASRSNVERGTCMKEDVLGHYDPPCSLSWWNLAGANDTERQQLQQTFNSNRGQCLAHTTQEACEGAELQENEATMKLLMGQLANTTLQPLDLASPNGTSNSTTNSTDLAWYLTATSAQNSQWGITGTLAAIVVLSLLLL